MIEFQQILFSALGVFVTGLVSWFTTLAIKWLNSKIKNKELLHFSTTVLTIVTNAVKATYQTYVESIKGTELWNAQSQKEALEQALITAKKELTVDSLEYIQKEHGDIDAYLKTLIESILYDLKNKNK